MKLNRTPFLAMLVSFALAAAGATSCLISWERYRDEQAFVAGLADTILSGADSLTGEEQEIRFLYNFMDKTVHLNSGDLPDRPFLRDSAAETLQKEAGLCGERSRVLIALLRTRGITARRVFLYGDRKGHVLVEVDYQDLPVIVDVFRRPSLQDRFLALSIHDYLAIPVMGDRWSAYSYFNWRRFFHLPYADKILPDTRHRPLPDTLAWVLESPRLIESLVSASIALLFTVLGGSLLFSSGKEKSRTSRGTEGRECE